MTKEEKPQFFGLYHGQRVMKIDDSESIYTVEMIKFPMSESSYLLLKPLSSITDEDAIEVAKMAWKGSVKDTIRKANRIIVRMPDKVNPNQKFIISIWFDSGNTTVWEWNTEKYTRTFNQCAIVDFLRSKCYAMPFKNYSVDDLIKEGLIKLHE